MISDREHSANPSLCDVPFDGSTELRGEPASAEIRRGAVRYKQRTLAELLNPQIGRGKPMVSSTSFTLDVRTI